MSKWRWERRAEKQERKRKRMPKHGKNIQDNHDNAILKRIENDKRKRYNVYEEE